MPYYPRGDMASLISDVAETEHASLPISTQARWCFQMTSAVKHAHDHGEYHKDLKPGNMLITSNDDVLLIDWEQALAPAITIAPEADGTWDVSYADDSPSRASKSSRHFSWHPQHEQCRLIGVLIAYAARKRCLWRSFCPHAFLHHLITVDSSHYASTNHVTKPDTTGWSFWRKTKIEVHQVCRPTSSQSAREFKPA